MTNEEAEQLIAEIEKERQRVLRDRETVSYDAMIKKIIKRFANRPPYVLTTNDNVMYLDMREHPHPKFKDKILIRIQKVGEDVDDVNYGIDLTIAQLTLLRDNCDKMLEYLNHE